MNVLRDVRSACRLPETRLPPCGGWRFIVMKALEIVLAVLLSLVSLALIAIVTLQSGKEAGLSCALSGGSNDSYLSKSKTGNRDKLLASLTKWIALAFAVLALVLNLV